MTQSVTQSATRSVTRPRVATARPRGRARRSATAALALTLAALGAVTGATGAAAATSGTVWDTILGDDAPAGCGGPTVDGYVTVGASTSISFTRATRITAVTLPVRWQFPDGEAPAALVSVSASTMQDGEQVPSQVPLAKGAGVLPATTGEQGGPALARVVLDHPVVVPADTTYWVNLDGFYAQLAVWCEAAPRYAQDGRGVITDASREFPGQNQYTVVPPLALEVTGAPVTAADSDPVFLRAYLTGANEVGGGDPDGRALLGIEIHDGQVDFGATWEAIGAPQAGHIHLGAGGVDGGVVLPFWTTPLPDGSTAVSGTVTDADPAVLARLEADPAGFYANLHTTEFPDGAVRGQLVPSAPLDLTTPRTPLPLTADLSGADEVAGGDPAATADGYLRARGTKVEYAFTLDGFRSPVAGHVHSGAAGVDGPIVVPLFASPQGLPATVTGLAGRVYGVNAALVRAIATDPSSYYLNLHTATYPDGIARGQLG